MYVEDNTDMSESYIMIDRMGASFRTLPVVATTTARQSWISAQPAFSHIQLSPARYLQRYTLAGSNEVLRRQEDQRPRPGTFKDGWTYWRGGRHGRLQAPSAIQPHDWLYAERSARIPEFQT
jgi:hypothetical protein